VQQVFKAVKGVGELCFDELVYSLLALWAVLSGIFNVGD
jgi:hypothetical protein